MRVATMLLAVCLLQAPAQASSLPGVDFGDRPTFGAGLGAGLGWQPGGSVSVDWPVMDALAIGAAVSSTVGGLAPSRTFELRGMYRLVEGNRETPAIAGIVGLWGTLNGLGSDPRFTLAAPIAPAIGFGLAYEPMDRLTLRLNLAYSPFYNYGREALGFIGGPPGSGLEAGWRLSPTLEVTAGINGNGDLLGMNWKF